MLITIDAHEVHDLASDMRHGADALPARAELVVGKVGHDMQARTQANIVAVGAVDTGHLLNSVSLDLEGLGFDLGPTAEYGGYVELGVDHPFEIVAHPGGVLAFDVDGETVFTRKVTHPPIPPRPYLGPAFDAGLPNLERALGSLGVQVVTGV